MPQSKPNKDLSWVLYLSGYYFFPLNRKERLGKWFSSYGTCCTKMTP